ncbi:hypothetical protein COCOR_05886 [Corallococcus coralloides DSM 2259]|uniref:Lipoprotein n=1 Tax=Corallococcus coralloides (strain ATCC 25202 / DSM 2259 / NBRC 100086 / M2) TaxID=1144275 RepID=H8MI98_CORCM|nr:hypothetical protein [Corallococcus coralloides]AFE06635.1 hypothetical protein COCOR_05886 [Corallococcus coralloides DSM 2259]
MRLTRALFPLLAILPLLACGDSDGGVGESCGEDGCDSGLSCRRDFPGTFCAQDCTAEGEGGGCPSGTLCTRQLDTLMCSPVCDSESDCRESYACNGVSSTNLKACQVKL